MNFSNLLKSKQVSLIVSIPTNNPELCKAAFEEGADAVKVHINVSHRASGTGFGRLAEEKPALQEMLDHAKGPMGLMLGAAPDSVAVDCMQAANMGFQFYSVYAHNIPAWSMSLLKGKLMAACDYSYTLDEILMMKSQGADMLEASIIPGEQYGSPLNMRDLLKYRSLVEVSKLPVVVPSQRAIKPEEVSILADTGIKALMIGAIVTSSNIDGLRKSISQFRNAIDKIGR